MQIEQAASQTKHEKTNIYFELFKTHNNKLQTTTTNKQESFENKMIHIGMIHNALGHAFIDLVQCIIIIYINPI